ncbi:hypothetical protein [Kineococcus auxinigenes]|uniref:hypothetical protein n=1 Tax=unclassified Kineococcus TaxID=2621656 RepID=UPI003D7DE152
MLDALADLSVPGREIRVDRVVADEARAHRPTRRALRRRRIEATPPEVAAGFEPPGAGSSGEELSARVPL